MKKVKDVCDEKVITKRPNQRAVLEGLLFGLLPQLFLSTLLLLPQHLFAYFVAELGKVFSVLLVHYIWMNGSTPFLPVAGSVYCLELHTPQMCVQRVLLIGKYSDYL